jgi:RNA polymerase sigma-70 factor, ECF subfamily
MFIQPRTMNVCAAVNGSVFPASPQEYVFPASPQESRLSRQVQPNQARCGWRIQPNELGTRAIQTNDVDVQAIDTQAVTHERALDQFLRAHERKALRMAELGTRNRDDAMDVVQDAMLSFVRRYADPAVASLAARADWAKLFYTVLDSRLTDWHRRMSVRNRFRVFFGGAKKTDEDAFDATEQVADPNSIAPDRLAMSSQSAPVLNAALASLPERQRQCFLLRIWQGFDVAQTAEVMRCSEGSVKTHLSRAMEKMRAYLEPHV